MASVLDVSTWTPELWEQETTACRKHLENVWDTIPLLNDPNGTFREGQVVGFRGMVQDGLGLNIHVDKYEVVNELTGDVSYRTGKYRLSFLVKPGEKMTEYDEEKYVDCYSFNCVSVPGLNPWAKELFLRTSNTLCDDKSPRKRSFDEMMEGSEDVEMSNVESDKSELATDTGSSSTKETESCIVKFFEKEGNELKLNTIIDAVGFYASNIQDEDQENGSMANQVKPVLLVLNFRILSHTCPLLPMVNFLPEVTQIARSSADALHNLRALFLPLLQGDTVAYECLLMNLVSHVFFRSHSRDLVKGQLSVNFVAIPTNIQYGERMNAILQQVVPKSIYLRCGREDLNAGRLVPFKNHDTEQLVQKPLQLAMGTVIVVDELVMDEGNLNVDGYRNIMHLTRMLCKQSLLYDFVYSEVEYNTDYPTIIFSDQKSVLKADVVVRLKPQQYIKEDELKAAFEAANQFLKNDSVVTSIRAFLAAVRHVYTGLGDETMEQYVTEDFVSMRESNPTFVADDFDRLLLLARWYALSHGKDHVDADVWQSVKLLDQDRIANLTS